MKAYFLSDLHLRRGEDPASLRFAAFLRSVPARGDLLLLGGDIFDLFVGNKAVFRAQHAPVLDALRAAAMKGVEVHYLEGNHDFHVKRAFGNLPNFVVHADDYGLEWQGTKIYVSHGDMIDPEDRGYRLLRAVTRHFAFRAFLRVFPGRGIAALGDASSKKSRQYNHTDAGGQPGRERLRALYANFAREKVAEGYSHVLVGHSHLRDQIELEAGEKRGEYINLGFSAEDLPYAELSAGAPSFELKSYT
jgi:UDP-2,3-diacylglucosamine hydrolase